MWAGPEWQRLGANRRGHDWLVGDLHGHRAQLDQALTDAGFDVEHDRLFATGDLVDRGDDPLGTLRLLNKPWFYSVPGNHDLMLLARMGLLRRGPVMRAQIRLYAQAWDVGFTSEQRQELFELLDKVRRLPLALVVDGLVPFWVVHAQRPMTNGHPWTDARMQRTGALASRLPELTWSRRVARDALWSVRLGAVARPIPEHDLRRPDHELMRLCQGVHLHGIDPLWEPGVGLTYTGHTIVPQPMLHRSHLMIDGGPYKPGGRLNLLRHDRVVAALASTLPTLPLG